MNIMHPDFFKSSTTKTFHAHSVPMEHGVDEVGKAREEQISKASKPTTELGNSTNTKSTDPQNKNSSENTSRKTGRLWKKVKSVFINKHK